MGQSFVVTSGKGGAGKTSVVSGVGTALSALGQTVVLIDADIGLRNLDLAMGLQEKTHLDLGDVLAGRCTLDDALAYDARIPRLHLLAAPSSLAITPEEREAFRLLVDKLSRMADFVLVDCAAGLGDSFAFAAGACQNALVVATPDQLSLRGAALCADRLTQQEDVRLVVNRIRPRLIQMRHAFNIDDAMDAVGLPLLGLVPEDEMVLAAQNHNMPVLLTTRTGAAEAYVSIAERLTGKSKPLPRRMRMWKVDA